VLVFSSDGSSAVAAAAASHEGVAVVPAPAAMREMAPLVGRRPSHRRRMQVLTTAPPSVPHRPSSMPYTRVCCG
jgi:DNA-binding transcriptional LysR family regulator